MKTERIVFWEPCLSPHKAGLYSGLTLAAPGIELVCCADHDVPQDRREMGWADTRIEASRVIVGPSDEEIASLARDARETTLHIFSGTRWLRTLVQGLAGVRKSGARFAVMSEPRVREGWRGELRFLQSWLTEGWLRRNAEFVLAIGRNGPGWFTSVGYPADVVFPYAYFVDAPALAQGPSRTDRTLRVGYVGRMASSKGVLELPAAVARVSGDCVLALAGQGPDEQQLLSLCQRLGVRVEHNGVLPMNEVWGFMAGLDVLVLASTHDDGWGAVVSEALMSGTAVIATRLAGASLVLDDPRLGRTVEPGSPEAIAEAIASLRESDAFSGRAREVRVTLSRAILSPEAGAANLLEIVRWSEGDGDRPRPFYDRGPA